MPELPEVETIVKQLRKKVVGKTIERVEVIDSKVADEKLIRMNPVKVNRVLRRGKSIIIVLDKNQYLLIHLRMTGHFHYGNKLELKPFEQFVVAKFYLHDGSILTHNSIRRFGSVKLIDGVQLEHELSKLGIEPLGKEFTLEKFNDILDQKKRSNIKTLLMNQSIIVGIGNIYAQEVLYHAGINPRRKVESLTSKEIKDLYHHVVRVLKLAVEKHGTTVENYVHIEGSGGFQKYLAVYGRDKCLKGHFVSKINIGGRGTYYCGECQD